MTAVSGTDPFTQALNGAIDEVRARLAQEVRTKEEWQADPVGWARSRIKRFLWSKQREMMESVRDNPRTAVKTCHTIGKTATAAAIAAWWIDSHEPGTAFVLTTAPTAPQVKALLWREINRLHKLNNLDGRTNLTEWYVDGELVAFGRKPSEYNESSFQGVHALYVLVIFDEACGIPETLWTAAESVASNKHSRILVIGNPDDNDSEFAKVCKPDSPYNVITVGYADTPAFSGESVPEFLLDLLISPEWVEARRQIWGEDSALFQSKCLGQFPDRKLDTWAVVPFGMATQCRYLELPEEEDELVQAGIDVGGGQDRTIIFERRGIRAGRVLEFVDPDPMKTTGNLVIALREWGVKKVKIDSNGIGWALCGRIKELSSYHNPRGECAHDAQVVPVNFGAGSAQPKMFKNKRAEVFWSARERSRQRNWDLGAVTDDVIAELTCAKYEILDSNGKVQIESKDEIIKRLGRSPDKADALLLAFHDGAGTADVDVTSTKVFAQTSSLTKAGGGRSVFGGMSFGR